MRIYRSEVKAHVAAVLSKLPQTFDELARKAPILRLGESFARQALRQMAVETYKSNGRELIVFYSLRPDRRAPTPPAI